MFYKKEIGKIIPGLTINGEPAPYGVLNERAVRATAGIMFAIGFFTLLTTFYTKEYNLLYFVVVSFFLDFLIKVLIGPAFSPFSKLGSFLVRKQNPEWVGAIQKRFAWGIGLAMTLIMIHVVILFEIR